MLKTYRLCDGMLGQNYWLHGCIAYQMACLGEEPAYDYWFFSDVSGDSCTQLFSRFPGVIARYPSLNTLDQAQVDALYGACGYSAELVPVAPGEQAAHLPRIRRHLDAGAPVLARREDFCAVCGYEDGALLCLPPDQAAPQRMPLDFAELIFLTGKTQKPALAAVYRRAALAIPACLTRPAAGGFSFGRQAFLDWADSLTDGRLAGQRDLDPWRAHGAYLCIAGTNGCAAGLVDRALALNPDLAFLEGLRPPLAARHRLFNELAYGRSQGHGGPGGMEGGFAITAQALRDPARMAPLAGKIRAMAEACGEMLSLFDRG